MKKKKEETLQYMKDLKLPENLIQDYEKGIVNITEGTSVYDINENQKARDYALPVGDLLETEVFHVVKTETKLGESWYFLIFSEEKPEPGSTYAYAYFPNSPLYSDHGIVKIKNKDTGIEVTEDFVAETPSIK